MTKYTLTNPRHNYNHLPFAPKKIPFFYGWAILVFSALGILMSMPGQTTGISAFTEHLKTADQREKYHHGVHARTLHK